MIDHFLEPVTDHCLGKLLTHQLANQTQAPVRVDSSFCFSTYEVLVAVVPLPRAGSYALFTRLLLETPLFVGLACVKHAANLQTVNLVRVCQERAERWA